MRSRLLLAALPLALLTGCGGGEEEAPAGADVQRIQGLSDCAALQSEFDQAEEVFEANEPGTEVTGRMVERMEAADQRMQELGC